jgi:hypothetical protein
VSPKHEHTKIMIRGSEDADEQVLFARMEQIRAEAIAAAAAEDDSNSSDNGSE